MSEYIYYDEAYVPKVFGLNNTGAICWCNAILQALLSCSSFNNVMLECKEILADNRLAMMYIKMIEEILPESTTGEKPVENIPQLSSYSTKFLTALIEEMKRTKRSIHLIGQSDANEGFHLFLDLLNCEHIYRLFNNRYEVTIDCINCKQRVSKDSDLSIQIKYHNKRQIRTQDDYCKYVLRHPSELEDYKCDKCKKVTPGTYRLCKLKMLREIVTVFYDKTKGKGNKDISNWYPEYMTFPSRGSTTIKYRLVAVVNWSGNINEKRGVYSSSGHYWSDVLRPSNDGVRIYNANDSSISPSGYSSPNSNVYMLMYHMV